MKVDSVFSEGGEIPSKYTCDGDNVSPYFEFQDVPEDVESFALIVDDPDSSNNVWVHWIVWNLPPDTKKIEESSVPQVAREGMNDFKKMGYGGPCPHEGVHHYRFTVYALNSMLELAESSNREELENAMNGHIIDKATLTGVYGKK